MARAIVALIVAFLVSTILAAPTQQLRKRSFKVNRIENKNYVANGRMALKRAYLKYGINEDDAKKVVKRSYLKFGLSDIESKPEGEVGTRVRHAANGTGGEDPENGETPAVGTQNDAQFLSPISVGGQQVVVNFDSGSSDLWVFNANLDAADRRGRAVYNQKNSRTFKEDASNTFKVSYGDGSFANGPIGFDTVDIGGSTVENQAIGLPTNVSQSFSQDTASNGLLGLAFSTLNTVRPQKQKTFFDNVLPNLSRKLFTAQLKGGTVGSYEFGNIDTSAFQGELQTVEVTDENGFWEFPSSRVVVNGKESRIEGSAIADTGTSLMLVGNDMLEAYWNEVEGAEISNRAGGVIFPCNAKLPDLQVAAGNALHTVDGVNMNFATVGRRSDGTTMCFGGLQSNGGIPFSIYGDVWFKSLFVAFRAAEDAQQGEPQRPSLAIARHA